MSPDATASNRIYHILGVPLRAGSHYPGSENDGQAYRDARVVERLRAAGRRASDDGDVDIPSYLPHHRIPPIRSWPAPRIAWERVSETVLPLLRQDGHVPLLVGGDCSIVVGSVQALVQAGAEDVHVLYLDGDIDGATPRPETCQSAAAMGLWLLTHASPFWVGPPLRPSQITVMGWSNALQEAPLGVAELSLERVRRMGPAEAARHVLNGLPPSASILLHFDVDVLAQRELPTAYFPRADGLTLGEARDLLGVVLADSRIRIIEVTEYASMRDLELRHVDQIIELLAANLVA